jgi:predicted ATPase
LLSSAAHAIRVAGRRPGTRHCSYIGDPVVDCETLRAQLSVGFSPWPVEPPALPERGAGAGEIEFSPAVQLLRDRAGAVRRDLAGADARTPATMARACRAPDGMPPAIDLAVARLRTMSTAFL